MKRTGNDGGGGGGFRVLYAPKAPPGGVRCGDAEGWTRAENAGCTT